MKINDIATKIIEEDAEYGEISFAIKALVENNSDDDDMFVVLQGIDNEGFEIYEVFLEGEIPIGESKVLTTKEDNVNKQLFDQIVKWQGR